MPKANDVSYTQTTYHVPPPSPPSIFCLSIRSRHEKLRLPRGMCGGWHSKTSRQININEKHINKGSDGGGEASGKDGANCVSYWDRWMESIKGLSQRIRTHTEPSTRQQAAPTNKYGDLNALRFAKFEFFILIENSSPARCSPNRNCECSVHRSWRSKHVVVAQRRQSIEIVCTGYTIVLLYFMSGTLSLRLPARTAARNIAFNSI